jgi:hypothetical protein
MLELIDTRPDLQVQESEYKRLLGYPANHELEGRPRELADWARQWYADHGRPWLYAREMGGLDLADDRLRLHGTEFASKQLHDSLAAAQAHSAVLVAVSAGGQCEEQARRLWQEGKPDEYFFLEMFGSAVVEHLVTTTGGHLCAWADGNAMAVLPHYSPGYSGWDIADQNRLWELIERGHAQALPERIHVMATGMLQPKKSLLAVFGITRHLDKVRDLATLVPCENCSLSSCQYRRVPYQRAWPQIEDVRRLQGAAPEVPAPPGHTAPRLDHEAKYTVNSRALDKWSRERLELNLLADRSLEARFHYEGTTCSNLGRPLEFEYYVRLGPAGDGYRILETRCAPASGDTGHQEMCEYLRDPTSLMGSIASEKPLPGRPLNDVLAWQRPSSPSGCYCDAERRTHKWGLVLEVIHYALVRREKAAGHHGHPAAVLE